MEKPPSSMSTGDIAREFGKAITSAIPVAGGPLQILVYKVHNLTFVMAFSYLCKVKN